MPFRICRFCLPRTSLSRRTPRSGRCFSKLHDAFVASAIVNLNRVRIQWGRISCYVPALPVMLLGGAIQLRGQITTSQTNYNPNGYDAILTLDAIEHPRPDLVVVIGHRGAHSLIDGEFPTIPENSLQSIRDAASAGWEAIEIDVKNSSDGIPLLTHDYTWGRETCGQWGSGAVRFNPFTAPGDSLNDSGDPQVSSTSVSSTRSFLKTTWLRDSISLQQNAFQNCSIFDGNTYTGEYPPTLQEVLTEMSKDKIAMVLTLDIKDAATAKASWDVLKSNVDYLGRSYAKSVIIKVPARNFKSVADYDATFPLTTADDPHVFPYFNTGDIKPQTYGSETAIQQNIAAIEADTSIHISALEIVLKQYNGILTQTLNYVKSFFPSTAIANFSPYGERTTPADPNVPEFFTNKGYCAPCDTLATYYFNGAPYGEPSDTDDQRGNKDFLVSQEGINAVTADDTADWIAYLTQKGLHDTKYLKPSGVASSGDQLSLDGSDYTPQQPGGSYVLLAQVSSPSATGSVTFSENGALLGTASLLNGDTSFTVSSITSGTHTYTASYSGDGTYPPASSNTLTLTVGAGSGSGPGGGTSSPGAIPLRLLPTGDSITWGYADPTGNGYRLSLLSQLINQGFSADFVGTQQNGQFTDNYNEGHSGYTIEQISGLIDGVLARYQPNVMTLMIGTNNCNLNDDPSGAPGLLTSLISQIYSDDPTIAIALATLIPSGNPTYESCIQQFNAQIPGIVAQFQAQGQHIVLADMSAVAVGDLVSDGVHPNATGYQKIANGFLTAVEQLAGNGWISNAPPCSAIPAGCSDPAILAAGSNTSSLPRVPQPRQAANGWIFAGSVSSGSPVSGIYRYADMNGDGKADFVVIDPTTGALTVYLNNGTDFPTYGGWGPPIAFASGAAPASQVVLADVTGDGKADYLIVDPNTGAVTAWQNNGGDNGGQPWTNLGQVAKGAASAALVRFADVNGDGKADYLVLDPNTGSVTAWLNNGMDVPGGGGWTNVGQVAAGAAPAAMVQFADLNGDGFADYLVLNPVTGAITAWLNNGMDIPGGSGWTPIGQIAAGSGAGSLVQFADINGDRAADYLVLQPSNGQTTGWLNNGGDSTALTPNLPQPKRSPQPRQAANGWTAQGNILPSITLPLGQIRYADMDGNGLADVVIIDPNSGALTVYLNYGRAAGAGQWANPIAFAAGAAPAAQVVLADVTGDGKADYLVVDPSTGAVTAWQNKGGDNGGGGWGYLGQIAKGAGPGALVRFADVNGDGLADYLVVDLNTGAVSAWLNSGMDLPGGGGWTPLGQVAAGGGPGSMVRFADINGDGYADYLLLNPLTGAVTAWLNNGMDVAGGGGWIPLGLIAPGTGAGSEVQFADIDGDGCADYLVVASNTETDAWLNNGGDLASSLPPVTLPPPTRTPQPRQAANGWIAGGSLFPGTNVPGEVRYADMNGDGWADVVVIDPNSGALTVYLNNALGGGTWSAPIAFAAGAAPASQVVLADVTGDGKADYLIIDPSTGAITAWQNNGGDNGGPGWSYLGQVAKGAGPSALVRFGDVNGDGKADFLVVDPNTGAVTAWLNNGMDLPGGGGWVSLGQVAAGGGPGSETRFADINGDGFADYLLLDPVSGAVTAWLNNGMDVSGGGGWTPLGQIAPGTGAGSQVQFADVNGDGRADYLVVASNGQTNVWLNNGGDPSQ